MSVKNHVAVLQNGYSRLETQQCSNAAIGENRLSSARANCSCVLITGQCNVIVDTMTPWDGDLILQALSTRRVKPEEISFVVSTHGHSDHIGNNNLFLQAKHIVGFCVNFKDKYFLHPFEKGIPYEIAEGIRVIPTPGHTADDVSVVVETEDLGTVVVAGDIFEREEDIEDPSIWRVEGGSADPERQERSRAEISRIADYIIPGHGPMFRVTDEIRLKLSLDHQK